MHDIKQIRSNPENFRTALARRGETHALDELLALDSEWRDAVRRLDEMRGRRNTVSKEIGAGRRAGVDTSALETEMRQLGDEIKSLEPRERELDELITGKLLYIPNLPAETTPDGRDASANVVVRELGTIEKPEFPLVDHLDLADRLQLLDFKRGGKIAGSGFPVWTGAGARLERALINLFLDIQTQEHGYREMMTPFVATRESMQSSGQIPKLEDDMYHIEKDDLFLIPTSEVTLVNFHRGEILSEDDLPLKYSAYSP